MKKTVTLFMSAVLLLVAHRTANAQGIKDRLFISQGFSTLADYAILPASNTLLLVSVNSDNQIVGTYQAYSAHSISYFTYAAKFRFNLLNLGDNSSISVHVQPALGVSYSQNQKNDENFWGSLSIPMMAGFNLGNVATRKTESRSGFGIAAGVEYYIGGLINNGAYNETFTSAGNLNVLTSTNQTKTAIWLAPSFELSYRFFTRTNKAHEISFLGSFGKKQPLTTDPQTQVVVQDGDTQNPMHLRLMYSIYFGY